VAEERPWRRRLRTELRARVAGEGSGWCPDDYRFAVYARDGHSCACCGIRGGQHGAGLTVDHIRSQHGEGGRSTVENMITMCNSCNSSKQDTPLREWVNTVMRERGHDPERIMARIQELAKHPIDLEHGDRLALELEEMSRPPTYNDLVFSERKRMAANMARERETGEPNRRNKHPLDVLVEKAAALQQRESKQMAQPKAAPLPVQRGKKGGAFVITRGGEKRYIGKKGAAA